MTGFLASVPDSVPFTRFLRYTWLGRQKTMSLATYEKCLKFRQQDGVPWTAPLQAAVTA